MRIPDSFTLHRRARMARGEEMGRLAGAAAAALRVYIAVLRAGLRRKITAAKTARTRYLELT